MLHSILLHAHSSLRWLALIVLVYGVIQAFRAYKKNLTYTANNKKLHLIGMTLFHIQLIFGLILYGLTWGNKVNFAQMSNASVRFFTVEHAFMMLIAIILVTIGFSRAKRVIGDQKKFKQIIIYWTSALVLILVAIPWPFRASLGAAWF